MRKIDTILFDLDGTLIDTNEIIIKSYQHAYKTHLPNLALSRQTIIDQIGPTLNDIFSLYTDSPFTVKALIDTYRAYYVENEGKYHKLYPKVYETLKTLKSKGYQLGIVTSKFKVAAWPSFTHYKLNEFIDVFIALDDVKNPKPDKEPVLKALSKFKSIRGAIMIGDNQGDILSGKNAGILSAGVAWSIKGKAHLNLVNPDYMFDTMDDIIKLLNTINEED
ncbi:MAG: pyrophosphatase PpaX [Candidatus Izemoplasmataceae bacterium]